MTHQRTIKSQK